MSLCNIGKNRVIQQLFLEATAAERILGLDHDIVLMDKINHRSRSAGTDRPR